MKKIVFILFLSTLWTFPQKKEVYIDSLTQEKTINYPSVENDLVGRYEIYYANETIKEKGQTAFEYGCGMKSGKFEYFTQNRILHKTKVNNNWLQRFLLPNRNVNHIELY